MTTDVTGSFMFPILMVHVSGTGHATHLGQFTLDENLLFNVITHGFVGQIMWTAANGDKLLGSSVGMFDPTTGATAGKTTFSGGTGRFENATGVIQFKGVSVSISPPLLDVTYDGVISSPGANKK